MRWAGAPSVLLAGSPNASRSCSNSAAVEPSSTGSSSSDGDDPDWRAQLLAAALDGGQLVRLTLRGRPREGSMPYRQAVIVPIMLKGARHFKVSTFTERQVGAGAVNVL